MKYLRGVRNHLVLCLALFLLFGCTLPSKFELFNNTGKELRVIHETNGVRSSFDLALNSSVTLESWESFDEAHITIIAGAIRWSYKPVYISHDYGEVKGFSHVVFRLQIEKDGSVFVLEPEKEFPQTKHIAQPDGYPLKPNDDKV